MNLIGPNWWYVNIGSGNGLLFSGNKPLFEPMLTQFCVIWHYKDKSSIKMSFQWCQAPPCGEIEDISKWCN